MPKAPLLEIPKFGALPLRQQAEHAIRQALIEGQFLPGQRITERELTAGLGVSRTLIREALRQLEFEGLISVIPNRGTVVRELNSDEIQDLYAIRAVLEGLAARTFTEKAGKQQLQLLGKAAQDTIKAYQSGDSTAALEGKNRFYDILVEGAASPPLSTMLGTLQTRFRQWRAVGIKHPQRSPARPQEAIAGIQAIWEAVNRRDAASAESATRDEARRGAAELLRVIALAPKAVAARH